MIVRGALALAAGLCLALAAHATDASPPPVRIHVVTNGWHAGLVLPAAGLDEQVPALRARFPAASHYEIGWGDVGFYQATEITVRLVFEALFASRGAVLHVVGVPAPLDAFLRGSEVTELCISAEGHRRMVRYIARTFVIAQDGNPVALRHGIYGDSQFYGAQGVYGMLNTCNRWTATALQAAGLPISPRLSLTADSVMRAAKAHGQRCPAPEPAMRADTPEPN